VKNKLTSTTFWVTVALALGAWLAAVVDLLPASWAAVVATASVVAYALSRGIAKWGGDMKRGYRTTEFWIGLMQIGIIVLAAVPGTVTDKLAAALVATVTAAYTISRGLSSGEKALTLTSVTLSNPLAGSDLKRE
jgi:hypothetical protein